MLKRLLFVMLAAMSLLLPTSVSAAVETPHSTLESVDPIVDHPQWQDVGMCDILAVTGGSTLTPPTTVRVVHDSPSGITTTTQPSQARHYNTMRVASLSHRRTISGYIYLIRCLRL